MTAQLVYRVLCDGCGGSGQSSNNPPSHLACVYCDGGGGSEIVLDPERVLQIEDPEFGEISFIRVQDVLDTLGGSDE